MMCSGCPPHAPHYGRCYNFDRCECAVEEPPLPFKEGAEWEGTDDQHEDLLEFGEPHDWLARELAEREKQPID